MEGIYIFFGQCTLIFFIIILLLKFIRWFWFWNIRNYTWIYQLIDYLIFKRLIKTVDYSIDDINNMLDYFKNSKSRVANGLFIKKAIKLLEEYKKEKFGL